jgi:hypothetical protein
VSGGGEAGMHPGQRTQAGEAIVDDASPGKVRPI